MRGYLVTTGVLFGLLAAVHLARTVAEWHRMATDRGFIMEGPGLGLVAAALCFWAFRLFRNAERP